MNVAAIQPKINVLKQQSIGRLAFGAWVRSICFLAAFAVGIGYVAARWRQTEIRPMTPVRLDAEWISTADDSAYTGYFRKTIHIPGSVKHAWLAVAAQNSFEVSINGALVGNLQLARHTAPFQVGLTEANQGAASSRPALGLNFPREYQWQDHDNARMPIWLDISNYLCSGANVIGIVIEARTIHPAMQVEGLIELWSGGVIPIRSDAGWKAEPTPPGVSLIDWTDTTYNDSHWRAAATAVDRSKEQLVGFDRRIFERAFAGRWVAVPGGASDESYRLKTVWELPEPPREAYLRVLANRTFQVIVNGQPLRHNVRTQDNQDSGQWIVNSTAGEDAFRKPELSDPDEKDLTLAALQGVRRIPDPVYDALRAQMNSVNGISGGSGKIRSVNLQITNSQTDASGQSARSQTADERDANQLPPHNQPVQAGLPAKPEGPLQSQDAVLPRSTLHDRSQFGYYAYDITALLKRGANSIELRLESSNSVDPANWCGKAAVDAGCTLDSGAETILATDDRWLGRAGRISRKPADWQPVQDLGLALTSDFDQPLLSYRGVQRPESRFLADWRCDAGSAAAIAIFLMGLGYLVRRLVGSARARQSAADGWLSWCGYCATVFLAAAIPPACTMIVEMSTQERDEHTWFLQTWMWQLTAAATALVLVFAAIALRPTSTRATNPERCRAAFWNGPFPGSAIWNLLVGATLVLGVALRVYQLDLQPLEDDEYASVQAVLAIAKTGAPGFVPEGVYYTRSPLFHYFQALLVVVFGENLCVLRLPGVLFGVATAWLTYWMGVRFFRSYWVGFAAMLLMVLHPYEIFTSHIARFYQQHQFFALLSIYWFCKGFVVEQSQNYRYLTVIGLLGTILTQEISVVLALQFLVCILLFGKDLGLARNARLFLLGAIACLWIFLDWAAFQTLCLTRLEGVSLNVEARIQPHSWTPFNFFSLFIGYSRLHLGLSLFLVAGLMVGGRNRLQPYSALFVILATGVIFTNLLITNEGFRYQYYLIPLWALLCLDGMRRFVNWLSAMTHTFGCRSLRSQPVAVFAAVSLFAAVVLSWSPWRIAGSYDEKLLPDSTGACRYVAGQIRPGDRVMATEPHPHAAFLEIGKIDFDLTAPILYDYVVMKNGVLIDRNGGAEVVASLQRLQRVFCENERVWILINREKFVAPAMDVNFTLPGARIEDFVRQNTELKYRSPFWSVYLWDRSQGILRQSEGG